MEGPAMARRFAPAFERFDRAELRFCRYLNRSSDSVAVRQLFRAISWLGDGWIWYALLAALPLLYGAEGGLASIHSGLTGAVGVLAYKLIKTRAVRERPYITHSAIHCFSVPLDRYSFPSGHTLHAVSFTLMIGELFPGMGRGARGICCSDRAVAHGARAALSDRRRGRRAARRRARAGELDAALRAARLSSFEHGSATGSAQPRGPNRSQPINPHTSRVSARLTNTAAEPRSFAWPESS